MNSSIIYSSGVASLLLQFITGVVDYYVLFWVQIPPSLQLLKQLLWMEFIVQIVELSFYVWMVSQFNKIKNITPYRYWDWVITTPTMLISLSVFLLYLKNQTAMVSTTQNLWTVLYENKGVMTSIVSLNAIMLLFGYLGEIKYISQNNATIYGFLPFLLYFYLIYEYFAKYSVNGTRIYSYFFVIWALYGVASSFSYTLKNISYNFLDLLSKNFFGLFLAGILYVNRISITAS